MEFVVSGEGAAFFDQAPYEASGLLRCLAILVYLLTPAPHSVWWKALTMGSLWELTLPEGIAHSWFLSHAYSGK